MVIKKRKYILSSLNEGSNKHWQIELHQDSSVWSRWGRIGEPSRETRLGEGEALFDAKCREKERKGYQPLSTVPNSEVEACSAQVAPFQAAPLQGKKLQEVATRQIETDTPEARALIERLVAANIHAILAQTSLTYNTQSGTFATPLGLLTQEAIEQARHTLTAIAELVQRQAWQEDRFGLLANRFMTLVPQHLPRGRRNCRDLFPDLQALREKNDVLDRLETSLRLATADAIEDAGAVTVGAALTGSAPTAPQIFDAKVHLVESRSEFRALNAKYQSTLNRNHACSNLKLRRAYTVEIAAMKRAFEQRSQAIGNIQELWHGTNTGNILSILKDGFRISPPATATITGKMFANGIYCAPSASKALNYAYGFWNGTRHKSCFMFLVDCALGRYEVPRGTTSKLPSKGYDSYWARSGQTAGIINDEIVVFQESQINPRYLLEFGEA